MADLASMEVRFPSLIDYEDAADQALLTLALADALNDVSETAWGDMYERGQEYLAAHLVTRSLADAAAAGGASPFAVQQSTADGVSATFAVPSDVSPALAGYYTTRYGVDYLDMLRRRQGGPHLVS